MHFPTSVTMAISSVQLSYALLAICTKFAAANGDSSATPDSLLLTPKRDPGTAINPYCKIIVHSLSSSDFQPVVIRCKNHKKSPLVDNYNSGFYPVNYMQADNGSMSRAIEGAVENAKARFPNKRLGIDMDVDGYHPLSSTKRYSGIVAVIDISSKLTANLGPNDDVAISIRNAGVRFDPANKAGKRIRLLTVGSVVLLDWDYLVGSPSIY